MFDGITLVYCVPASLRLFAVGVLEDCQNNQNTINTLLLKMLDWTQWFYVFLGYI